MTLDPPADLSELATPELLAMARSALTVLAARWAGPTTADAFEPVGPSEPELDWSGLASIPPALPGESVTGPESVGPPALWAPGSLPVVQRTVEELGRVLTAVHTTLAGHTASSMEDGHLRERYLGIPDGARPFRDAPDWMVRNLRIPRPEARRRIDRARLIQPPPPEPSGHQRPAAFPVLAEAFQQGAIDHSSLDRISGVLRKAAKDAEIAGTEATMAANFIADGEEMLTGQATILDPDSMRHACIRWQQWAEHALNPDGTAPLEAEPNVRQGLSYEGKRRGLHLWKIAADDLQHEILSTIAGAATNPRASSAASSDGEAAGHDETGPDGTHDVSAAWSDAGALSTDPRTRHQRQLDGLTSALTGALALVDGNGLPASGGSRPQVIVTVDFQTLLGRVAADNADPPDTLPIDLKTHRADAIFTGPIAPTTIRVLACDGDILPVVMGGAGQVLDVGRAQRLFPARLRKAITARDGGCTAPECTMPAPWCEAHHVEQWESGGPTSVDNGVLLCSRHHHAVHSGQWTITMEDGRPWFVPAPHLDPFRTTQRNHYWRP